MGCVTSGVASTPGATRGSPEASRALVGRIAEGGFFFARGNLGIPGIPRTTQMKDR